MSDKRTDRRRCTGLLFQTALCWTLIGLCCAGPRPADRGQRTRYTRHHDRWFQGIQIPSHHGQGTQRIEFPSVNDEGTQRVRYPSVNDGQAVRYPLVNDSGASSQIQKCAPGYYRDRSGPFLGRCVRCDCNGLSDECEERTGRCLGCQYNTAGDQCERCKEGYYGNAAQRTCRVCPCPLRSNSFAIGCKEVFGDFECVCRAGYTGDRCERCAPGYYGDPSTQGGSCRPCKCNGNYCDHRTGVCKSPLEPEDTNTDDHCQECDNCAQTLLFDLEKLDGELLKIKTQLTNASASATSQDRLKKLEKAVADTKILVNRFSSAINSQKSRVNQLEEDVSNLSDDISTLRDEAGKSAAQADKAVADVANTQTRAKDLDSEIQKMLKKIQALLDQLKDAGTGGGVVPNENLAKMLEEAQRLVKEMNERNFTPQKTAAAKERDEAEKLLDFIKANVSKQSDQNEAQAQNLGGLLKDYEAKLKDLEKALKEASDLLKKANTQNGLSAPALEDLKKRIKGLKMERDTVQGQITLAEKELQKTEDLAKMLSKSKEEYEQLAAQMDGAKTDLTKKVKEITEAASKKDLVEAAEDHANNLSKLAKELESAVANATGQTEVRNAKDAIDAYRNITDAINAAEAAANEAQSAADGTLNDLKKHKLTVRAKDLKETSEDLLKNAQEAETNLQDTADDITDLKNRLKDAAQKKTALQRDLADAQNQLNGIDRDGVSATIDEAKRKAASANNSATATMDRLNAIRGELEKIKVTPVDSNLNLALNDVDETVKNLLKTIPSLDDKLSEMENLTSEFPPMSNISENIYKIKDLIEQARDAANRIGIPMMFKGESHVELRAPKNLEDLKAYTSLMLSLQRPLGRGDGRRRRRQAPVSGNMFVLYLGNRDSSKNYIGMALKNEVLFAVYKLNGVEYKMETGIITKSVSVPAKFDIVDLRRIYQDAKMTLTKFTNSKTVFDPMTAKSQGEEDKNLLDLSPSDIVFYVGGYPDDFTPPASLNYPKYEGCIEFSSVNDKVVSLYNFRNAVNINPEPPCKRYVPRMDTDFYEGTGYGKVLLEPKRPVLLINMIVSSRSSNGLLLYIESEDAYITATIEKGVIFLRSNLLQTPATLNIKSFPTSDFKQFSMIILPNGDVSVRISSIEVAKANARFNFDGFKECYIGGAPKDVRERYNITMQPFKGCVKNLKQNSDVKSVSEPVGISKGCPKDSLVVRKADFSTGGTLSGDLTDFSLANDVVVSLGFKSTQNEGVILHDTQRDNGIQLALQSGHVILSFNKEIWKSNKQYQDGKWHYLTATRRNGRANLLIDDDDAGQEVSGSTSVPDTSGLLILGKDNFKGCVTNLYTRRPAKLFEAEDLNDFVASGDVLLDVCSADTLAQLMLDRSMKDVAKQATNETKSACALPATIQKAYRMGGPVSSLSYSLPLQALPLRPHFSLDVRTRASEGLLFFAATRGGRSHLALYISKGRIRLSVAKEKEIFNREKYNDGKWHSVIFSLEKKKFRLVVDGIRAQDGQLTNAELTSMQHLVSPVYLGSAPESLHRELKLKALPKQSVSGCIRNFKKNGAPMLNPTTNHGAGPCFEGQTQRGAYFAGNGSRVLLNDSFILGSSFELLFDIRPRSPTGLLLHVGELRWNQHGAMGHYLTVYMLRGEVVAQANNGKGEFKVSVKPKDSLCDETFHKISVIKRKNVVQLHVDTMDHYKIGPPSPVIPLTKDSLYVGGIPEMATQQKLPVTSSFVGCIQDMRVNGDSVSFDRPPAVFGPVNLKECPG